MTLQNTRFLFTPVQPSRAAGIVIKMAVFLGVGVVISFNQMPNLSTK
jgi:hypothetical protein